MLCGLLRVCGGLLLEHVRLKLLCGGVQGHRMPLSRLRLDIWGGRTMTAGPGREMGIRGGRILFISLLACVLAHRHAAALRAISPLFIPNASWSDT